MTSQLHPYLNFNGNARQAMEFYQSVFGGNLSVSTFKEFQASRSPADDDRIMHSMLAAENGIAFMGSDVPSGVEIQPATNFSLSLSGENAAELSGYFAKLSEGGTVVEPLVQAPWGDTFGMLKDKFGVDCMVNITAPRS